MEAEKELMQQKLLSGDPVLLIPKEELLNPRYLSNRLNKFVLDSIVPSSKISYGNTNFENNESSETTHYSIVDTRQCCFSNNHT